MQGIKPCSITMARKNNRIKNKIQSARATALALMTFYSICKRSRMRMGKKNAVFKRPSWSAAEWKFSQINVSSVSKTKRRTILME